MSHNTSNLTLSSSNNSGNRQNTFILAETRLVHGFQRLYPKSVYIVEDKVEISCYQLFLVEQWVPDRNRFCKTVFGYTGEKDDKVIVSCFKFIDDEVPTEWNQILLQYEADKARPMETAHGRIMVTNLSTFSSLLNLVPISSGSFESDIEVFELNMNLRRLGCSGRAALTTNPPSGAQKDRFRQIFSITNDVNEFQDIVKDLIRLMQISLYFLALLDRAHIDGFLCDKTVEALNIFAEIWPLDEESEAFVCGPSQFACIISKIMVLRNRIHSMGTQCTKNPYNDIDSFQSSIMQFQKSNKLQHSGFLSYETLGFIEKNSAKSSPPMVKKKVFRAKSEDSSANQYQETSDLHTLLKTFHIDSFKSIWGKQKKSTTKGEVIMESAHLAEDFFQGGKEFWRNVSHKAVRVPDGSSNVIKGFRNGVFEGISRISNSVEGFRERRRATKAKLFDVNSEHSNLTDELEIRSSSPESESFFNDRNNASIAVSTAPQIFKMRRSYSVGAVEDWNYDLPVLQRRASLQDLNDYDISDEKIDAQSTIHTLIEDEKSVSETINSMRDIVLLYQNKIQNFSEVYNSSWKNFSDIENILNDLMAKNRSVQENIKEFDTNISKLKYDISEIDEKNREIEDSIQNFRKKIKLLNSQVSDGILLAGQYDIGPLFSWIWGYITGKSRTSSKTRVR